MRHADLKQFFTGGKKEALVNKNYANLLALSRMGPVYISQALNDSQSGPFSWGRTMGKSEGLRIPAHESLGPTVFFDVE